MTEPVISTKSDDVSVTLALAANALATARQRAMPSAAEAAGALILGAFEGGVSTDIDSDLRVSIAYARGAAAWLVTKGIDVPWGPELRRRCDLLAPALDTVCAGFRPASASPLPLRARQGKPRQPTTVHAPSLDDDLRTAPRAPAPHGMARYFMARDLAGMVFPVSEDTILREARKHGIGRKMGRAIIFSPADIQHLYEVLPCYGSSAAASRPIGSSAAPSGASALKKLQALLTDDLPRKSERRARAKSLPSPSTVVALPVRSRKRR
jgi:hypothetical protein